MADFDDNQVNTVAMRFGMTPDAVKNGLLAEGHRVIPSGQPAFPDATVPGIDAPAPPQAAFPNAAENAALEGAAPVAPAGGQWFGAMPAGEAGSQNATRPEPYTQATRALQNLQSQRATTPGAQTRGGGIRAVGLSQQPQPGQAQDGSMSRVRKLFDAREKGIAKEYQTAAEQADASNQRMRELQSEAFGFEQDRLNQAALRADEAEMLYSDLQAQQQEAMAKEEGARIKEDEVIQAGADRLLNLRNEAARERVKERSWGSRLGSALAVALSGFGDALVMASGKGQANAVENTMAIVNDAIDRDVQEKLRQIQEKKGAANAYEQRLKDMRDSIGDDRAFRAMARSQQQEAFALRMDELGAKATSDVARNTANSAATQFRLASEASMNEALNLATSDARKRLQQAADARFGLEVGAAMPKGGKKDETALPGIGGLRQLSPDATTGDRTKAQETINGASNVLQTIDQLISMAGEGMTLSPDKRQIARRRISALKSQFNGAFGDGTAPNEAQLEALDEMFTNPTEANFGDARKQFEVFRQDAKQLTNAKLRTYGYQIDEGGSNSFREE